jgi:16S rRNA (guanine527-N7)-methyltransferase
MEDPTEDQWNLFRDFVQQSFGLSLSEEQIKLFKIYLEELKLWNEKFNLVSYKTDKELIFRHFADSLSALIPLAKLGKADLSVVDLGAGAGFPGIPLKIAMPGIQLTLIESIAKKCSFLENLVTKL